MPRQTSETRLRIRATAILAAIGLSVALTDGVASAGDDYNADSHVAAATLQKWYNSRGLWDSTGWWNAANCVDAVENLVVADNGGVYLGVISNTFQLNSDKRFLNEYYDDEGWWAEAWIRAYDLTGDVRYLQMAKTIFQDMTGGWNSVCDGGVQWKKDRRYKNAIPNELFLLVAIRLHQRTPGDRGAGSYLDWAMKEWAWFKQTRMINPQNLVNDGLNRRCENNGRTTWTYNQGVIIGALTDLYKSTGDTNCLSQAVAIADAATAMLVDGNGVLREPCEPDCGGGDVPQFKGIFIRHLAYLYDVTHKPAYRDFLVRNARSIWANDRNAFNQLGLIWSGPFDVADAARHSSAMTALGVLAEPVTRSLPFARPAGSGDFDHSVGTASGMLAWTCDSANDSAGLMLSGPGLASLSAGRHVVHFRMAAGSHGSSNDALARLEVKEEKGGSILASRDVPWNSFTGAGEGRDFSLAFTNAVTGNPLDFQVYWNKVPGAGKLTVTDVTVDGAHNWVAANLDHEVGRLDGMNNWEADPVRDRASGFLARGPGVDELAAGNYTALFELKVDNLNWDNSRVALLTVADATTGTVIATKEVTRRQFPDTLYHAFAVPFRAEAGERYDFRTYWIYAPAAPWLTLRSAVVVKR